MAQIQKGQSEGDRVAQHKPWVSDPALVDFELQVGLREEEEGPSLLIMWAMGLPVGPYC